METLKDIFLGLIGLGLGILLLSVAWTLIAMFWPAILGLGLGGNLINNGHTIWGIVVIILGILFNITYLAARNSEQYES